MADRKFLETVRLAQKKGLLKDLSAEKKAKILSRLEGENRAELEGILSPKPTNEKAPLEPIQVPLEGQNPIKEQSVGQQLTAPITSSIDNPGAAAANVTNAITSTLNPLPIVQALNPFKGRVDLDTDLETFQSVFNFPIIRGAELAARLFIPESEAPDLTTFAETVKSQKELNDELTNINPGVREGTEAGLIGVSIGQLGSAAVKGVGRFAKSDLVKKTGAKIQNFRAKKLENKARKLSSEILGQTDGPLLEAVLKRPEKIKKILDSGKDVTIDDVAIKLKDDLETISENLGKRVGKFRDKAFADTTTRMRVPEEIVQELNVIKQRTTLGGKSVLPPKLQSQLDRAEKMSKLGVATPNQQMIMVDLLDDVISYGTKNDINSVKSVAPNLGAIRRGLKENLRTTHPEWAQADDAFAKFSTNSKGLINRLNSDSAESLVSNLFGANKSPLRNRLQSSLDAMESVDPTAQGYGNAFFSRLSDLKAGQNIQTIDKVNRLKQERVFSTLRKYELAGAAMGGGVSRMIGLSPSAATFGATAGARIGNLIGKSRINPSRILKAASKSNKLSKNAKTLAKDMGQMVEFYGPEASVAFLDVLGPIPAVKELITFTNNQPKEKQSEKQKN